MSTYNQRPRPVVSKPGRHGTLHLYRVVYLADPSDAGHPRDSSLVWAYNAEHAEEKFLESALFQGFDDAEVVSVARWHGADEASKNRKAGRMASVARKRIKKTRKPAKRRARAGRMTLGRSTTYGVATIPSGYLFAFQGKGRGWKRSSDELWEVVMGGPITGTVLGYRTIDGSRCIVVEKGGPGTGSPRTGKIYAAMNHMVQASQRASAWK